MMIWLKWLVIIAKNKRVKQNLINITLFLLIAFSLWQNWYFGKRIRDFKEAMLTVIDTQENNELNDEVERYRITENEGKIKSIEEYLSSMK